MESPTQARLAEAFPAVQTALPDAADRLNWLQRPLFETRPATTRPEFLRTLHTWVSWPMHVVRVRGGAISDPIVDGTGLARQGATLPRGTIGEASRDPYARGRSHYPTAKE